MTGAPVAPDITIDALRREVADRLGRAFAGDDRAATAALDARLILAHATGLSSAGLIARGGETVPADTAARVRALAERRAAGEPVARLTGGKEFYGLALELSAETLVPRPDTETLVDAALGEVAGRGWRGRGLSILDLGTGSGAILLALMAQLPEARGLGVDISADALATAARNAHIHGLAGRAAFARCDWAEGVAGTYDLVVSNPPYIESDVIAGLDVEVREHDPRRALDGGADGLDAYRRIVPDLAHLLAPDGVAFLEIGDGQAAAVAALATEEGFAARLVRDLGNRERVVVLTRARPGPEG